MTLILLVPGGKTLRVTFLKKIEINLDPLVVNEPGGSLLRRVETG